MSHYQKLLHAFKQALRHVTLTYAQNQAHQKKAIWTQRCQEMLALEAMWSTADDHVVIKHGTQTLCRGFVTEGWWFFKQIDLRKPLLAVIHDPVYHADRFHDALKRDYEGMTKAFVSLERTLPEDTLSEPHDVLKAHQTLKADYARVLERNTQLEALVVELRQFNRNISRQLQDVTRRLTRLEHPERGERERPRSPSERLHDQFDALSEETVTPVVP